MLVLGSKLGATNLPSPSRRTSGRPCWHLQVCHLSLELHTVDLGAEQEHAVASLHNALEADGKVGVRQLRESGGEGEHSIRGTSDVVAAVYLLDPPCAVTPGLTVCGYPWTHREGAFQLP